MSVLLLLVVSAGLAQDSAPALDVQRFSPSGMISGFAGVYSGRQLGALQFSFEVGGGYAYRPIQASVPVGDQISRNEAVIEHLGAMYARGAFAPVDWLQIGVGAPIVQFATLGPAFEQFAAAPQDGTGFGDVDIELGFRPTTEQKDGVGLTLTPFVSAPSGSRDLLLTRGVPTFGARAALSGVAKPVHLAGFVGYRVVLGSTEIDDYLTVDDQLEYGVGVGFLARDELVRFNLEALGNTVVGPGRGRLAEDAYVARLHTGIEAGASLLIHSDVGLGVVVAGYGGATPQPGTPSARAFFGIGYVPVANADPDGDGVTGKADACPRDPEDIDTFQDLDGCPDPDNDGDGVLDAADACRGEPEDVDGFRDDDGCPDLDNDGDGVPDVSDGCPLDPEDLDGFEDADGCPEYENDGDGIPDDKDLCRDDPEDFDGFEDEDGCPDRDNDHDRLADADDRCPNEPEDHDGFQDDDGCPDPDNDGDGFLDPADHCVDDPEDFDGFADDDGCPEDEGDADADGVLDSVDRCPDEPEDIDGFQDDDGCRDPDNDGDAIMDPEDLCPDEPEVYNGEKDEDGCPDETLAVLTDTRIIILENVHFFFGEARIVPESYPVLDAVVGTLLANPQVTRVRVEGHTDYVGTEAFNLDLSERRADAIVAYLIEHGVAAGRLVAKGYGEIFPIAPNDTPEGRELNRRVEFMIEEEQD
ncbi:MAG TPA: OmpA family protein [Myxococcota bacterium]|nr:OmpA family protein [Myxococcota bacterium]